MGCQRRLHKLQDSNHDGGRHEKLHVPRCWQPMLSPTCAPKQSIMSPLHGRAVRTWQVVSRAHVAPHVRIIVHLGVQAQAEGRQARQLLRQRAQGPAKEKAKEAKQGGKTQTQGCCESQMAATTPRMRQALSVSCVSLFSSSLLPTCRTPSCDPPASGP